MDLPTYNQNLESENFALENYNQELNQTLRANVGLNGFAITNMTDATLRTTPILNPSTGTFVPGVASLMPAGTVYFITDASPPGFVGQVTAMSVSSGSLVRFSTVAYP